MKHIEQGLRGAWLVFIGQTERGFACFDTSKQGVWRSFMVFFLLVPFYGALLLKEGNNALAGAVVHGFLLLVLVEGIAWLFYPLIMRDVARALQTNTQIYAVCGRAQLDSCLSSHAFAYALPVGAPKGWGCSRRARHDTFAFHGVSVVTPVHRFVALSVARR